MGNKGKVVDMYTGLFLVTYSLYPVTKNKKKSMFKIFRFIATYKSLIPGACGFLGLGIFLYGNIGVANAADTIVSGTISLPDKVAAYSDDKTIRVNLMSGWTGTQFQSFFQCSDVVLPAHERQTDYLCSWPEWTTHLSGEFGIYINTISYLTVDVTSNLPGIHEAAYYTSTGSTPDEWYAERLQVGSTYVDMNIELIPTLTVNIIMQTPPGQSFDTDQDIVLNLHGNVTIEDGEVHWTSGMGADTKWLAGSERLEYTFETPDPVGDFIFHYEFYEGFGQGFLQEGYYSNSGIVSTIEQATLQSSDPSRVDLLMTLPRTDQLGKAGSMITIINQLLLHE